MAREALDEFVTREEAMPSLATKADINELNLSVANLRGELYRSMDLLWLLPYLVLQRFL